MRDTDIVRADRVTGLRLDAITLLEVLDDQFGGCDVAREVDLGFGGVGVKTHDRRASQSWVGGQMTARMSMTNTKVSLAPITGGEPLAPYPSAGGTTRRMRLPTVCPTRPLSQPVMTWPC